jgi:hypothetical protein
MTKVGTRNSTNMRWPSNKTFRLQVKFIFSTPTFPCTYSQDEEKSEMNPDTDHHLCVKFESNFDFDPSFNFFKRKCMNFQGRWKTFQGRCPPPHSSIAQNSANTIGYMKSTDTPPPNKLIKLTFSIAVPLS